MRCKRRWTYDEYLRLLKLGRGQGVGIDYKPWITVYDFPSKGKVCRIQGMITGRLHHLLSTLERMYFIILDNSTAVTDIREQFPLDLRSTLIIAKRLEKDFPGMMHPQIHGFPFVMTTDFLIDTISGQYAATVKPREYLDNPRVKWKFAIEQEYWKERNIPWQIITEADLNQNLYTNYQWLRYGEPLENLIPNPQTRLHAQQALKELYQTSNIPFYKIVEVFETLTGYPAGTTIQLFKKLILENRVAVDLTRPIDLLEPRIDHGGRKCCYI